VIRARDVIFDEDQVFDGNLEKIRDDCLNIDLDDLSALLTQLDVSQRHENDPIDPISEYLLADILVGNPGALDETVSEPDEGQDLMQLAQQALDAIEQGPSEPSFSVEFTKGQPPYPTPPQSPPAALLAATTQGPESHDLPEENPWLFYDLERQPKLEEAAERTPGDAPHLLAATTTQNLMPGVGNRARLTARESTR
jgi:hypothetical protein